MGWIATAKPETPEAAQAFERISAEMTSAGLNPDMLIQGGAVHITRHKRAICRAANVSEYAKGLDLDAIKAIAGRVRAPDLRQFLQACIEHSLHLQFLS